MIRDLAWWYAVAFVSGWLFVAAFVHGCAGWTAADSDAFTHTAIAARNLEEFCAAAGENDAGENYACTAARVRALNRMIYCLADATLTRHGAAVPDAGIACQP